MRSLNSTDYRVDFPKSKAKQNIQQNHRPIGTNHKAINLLAERTGKSLLFGRFWLWDSMYWLLRVGMTHTSWRYDRRGKHGCSCIYSCESRTLTFVVYRFDPSANRGFRYMYADSIVRGWRLGAGESVRAGIRCEGLSEEHEREEDAER